MFSVISVLNSSAKLARCAVRYFWVAGIKNGVHVNALRELDVPQTEHGSVCSAENRLSAICGNIAAKNVDSVTNQTTKVRSKHPARHAELFLAQAEND